MNSFIHGVIYTTMTSITPYIPTYSIYILYLVLFLSLKFLYEVNNIILNTTRVHQYIRLQVSFYNYLLFIYKYVLKKILFIVRI